MTISKYFSNMTSKKWRRKPQKTCFHEFLRKTLLKQSGKVPRRLPSTQKQWLLETVPAFRNWQKTQNMKINIEFDPGRSQERRKQCAFDFQCIVCLIVLCFLFIWCEALSFTIAPHDWGADRRRRFRRSWRQIWQNVNEGQTKAPKWHQASEINANIEFESEQLCLKHFVLDRRRKFQCQN